MKSYAIQNFKKVWVNRTYMVPVNSYSAESNNVFEAHQLAYRRIKQAVVGCGFDWTDALVETYGWPVRIWPEGGMRSIKYAGSETFVTTRACEDFVYAVNHNGNEPPPRKLILT